MRRIAGVLFAGVLLAGCDDGEPSARLTGYVEGDYFMIAPETAGRIEEVPVDPGDKIEKGTLLARLESTRARARQKLARAEYAAAEAELADLRLGRRPEEIRVFEARIASAKATFETARRELARLQQLKKERVVADATLDQAQNAKDTAEARLHELTSELEVAQLPARAHAITAAEHRLAALRAAQDEAAWNLSIRELRSPAAGVVEEVYFKAGEVVAAGQPVISILPENGRKIRFFVEEPELAGIRFDQPVKVGCDGCLADLAARISFIATEPEYTPPVLFGADSRAGLVFKIEADLDASTPAPRVGQPVDVVLTGNDP